MSNITHVELRAGGTTWCIAASIKNSPSNVRANVVVNSTVGILSPGELGESPIPRSYSDGSVYNPNATRSGKNIVIPITFYAESEATLRSDWLAFEQFIMTNGSIILQTYGISKTYTCQAQGLPVEEDYKNSMIKCTLILVSREAF